MCVTAVSASSASSPGAAPDVSGPAAGAGGAAAANDGVLWLRLTGDADLGAQIVVTLLGPDGSTTNVNVSAADAEDGNTLRFPETGPGTLAEGNYLVLLTQGATQATASIAIPGAP